MLCKSIVIALCLLVGSSVAQTDNFSCAGGASLIKNGTTYKMTIQYWCNGQYEEILNFSGSTQYSQLCSSDSNITVKITFDNILAGKAIIMDVNRSNSQECLRSVKLLDLSDNSEKKLFPTDNSLGGAVYNKNNNRNSDNVRNYGACTVQIENNNLYLFLGKSAKVLIALAGSF